MDGERRHRITIQPAAGMINLSMMKNASISSTIIIAAKEIRATIILKRKEARTFA